MKKSFKILSAAILTSTMAFGLGATILASNNGISKTEAYYTPSTHYEVSDTASELTSYYSTVSSTATGTTLLSQLQSLNSTKRKKTVGYSGMGTDTSGAFIYTDYDLNNTTTDSNGQKYGTKVASFYTKTSATSWNREHTWPKSHGGNLIESDILMTRPTITEENSDRGNSFYVEGKSSQSAGWDPYTAGYAEWCRGECARIILYGCVANSNLSLSDADSHSTSNANPDNLMGNINTLIKWHFAYTPNEYEMNRNNGAEYLQGNRNPFVDHPEYVAKIWSSYNSTVSNLCTSNSTVYSNWTVGSCSTYGTNNASGGSTNTDPAISITASANSVKVGNTITLTALKTNLTGTVQWYVSDSSSNVVSLSASTGDSITVTGVAEGTKTIYAHIGTVSAHVDITVTAASSGNESTAGTIVPGDLATAYETNTSGTAHTSSDGNIGFKTYQCANYSSKIQWKKSTNAFLYSTSSLNLSTIKINGASGGTLTVYGDNTAGGTSNTITGSNGTYNLSGYKYFYIKNGSSNAATATSIEVSTASAQTVSISLDKSSASVAVNGTVNLTATASGGTGNVTWSTSSSSIAQLNTTTGTSVTVTGKAAGTATITASYSGKTATCTITVTSSTPTVNSVTVSPSTLSLDLNGTKTGTLTATVSVSNGAAQTVNWSSSNTSIATVSSSGVVTGVAAGTATITATSTVDSSKKGTCTVTVISGSTSTDTYDKVTTSAGLTSGQYLIVYEDGNLAFNGGLSPLDAVSNTISVTVSSNQIAKTSTTTAAEFTIDAAAGTILSASGYYIGRADDTNGLTTSTSEAYANTISFDSGNANIVAAGGAYLRYNATEGQTRFRYYKSTSYTNQQAIQLYKLSGSVAKTLSSISVSNPQTSYTTGDAFVKPTVTATFSDSTTADVTNAASFSGFDLTTAGNYTVTVSYTYGSTTKTTTYSITVAQGATPVSTYEQVTGSLSAGDKVVIVAQANRNSTSGYAMTSSIVSQYYFDKAEATISNQKLNYTSTMAVWTVGGDATNGFTFYNETEAKYFYGYTTTSGTKTYRDLGLTTDSTHTGTKWTVTANNAGTGYDMKTTHNSNNLYLEYYTTKGNFSAYTASATDVVINFYKETSTSTNPALEYAQNFLAAFTCDATGATAPTFASGKSWASLKTAFNSLSTPHQNTLRNATANENGTDIEKAMARYDYVVAKYGYENFINRASGNSANRMNTFHSDTANNLLLVLGSMSLLGGLTYLAYFLKKRKED